MKRYIKSSTNSKIEVVSAEPEYTGGNIWNFTGKLSNGNYFVASDADCAFVELDEDPTSFSDEDTSNIWYSDWFDIHNVKEDHTEEEYHEFWTSLISWLTENTDWVEYTVEDILKWLDGSENTESNNYDVEYEDDYDN